MEPKAPYVREAGAGTPVVCIHSSASSSGQWRALIERLADRFRVIAVDLYGAGKTDAWPHDRPMRLDDEIDLLRSVFDAAGERVHVIGHSFGGAVALKYAVTHPNRLLSLAVYEPVLFSVLMEVAPRGAIAREILAVRDDTIRLVGEGDLDAAAERFVDYWSGDGVWAATPTFRRPTIAAAMRTVNVEWHAAFSDPTPLRAFAALDVPTLLMTGGASRVSAQAVAGLLTTVLPDVRPVTIDGVGHMAPITHPQMVNRVIERFVDAVEPRYGLATEEPHHAGLH